MLLSFVIPCYHSSATLPQVVHEIEDTVRADGRYDYEVILVNDNPPDDTWNTIRALCAENSRVRGVSMSRNFGQQPALMAGYRLSRGDIVVSLDDDGQTPPKQAFRLIDTLDDSVDIVYASYDHKQHALWRNLGSKLYDWVSCWLTEKPKGLYLASYYAAKRFVIEEMIRYQGPSPYIEGLAIRSSGRMTSVPVDHAARTEGRSGYSLGKLIGAWFNCLTSFSVKPLRLAAFVGLAFAGLGFLMSFVVAVQKLALRQEIDAGWTSLICVMLILGGLILTVLGILGEYIGRLCQIVSAAPQYVVLEHCNLRAEETV